MLVGLTIINNNKNNNNKNNNNNCSGSREEMKAAWETERGILVFICCLVFAMSIEKIYGSWLYNII